MHYATIKKNDIADGEGIRVGLYVSGCTRGCPGCHNKEAQNFSYGKPFNAATISRLVKALNRKYVEGLSILGGEPMEPANQETISKFLCIVKAECPHKSIWLYTGCTLETELLKDGHYWRTEHTDKILSLVDVLVDGPYIEARKNIMLKFRGSSNQRILKLHPTVEDISNKG